MDTLLDVLTQAAGFLGSAAATEAAKRAVGEGWEAVKRLLQRPGIPDKATGLLNHLQQTPTGPVARQTLAELAALRITADPAMVAALEALSQVLARERSAGIQQSIGTVNGIGFNQGPVTLHFNDKS